jgi:hypothetical protein
MTKMNDYHKETAIENNWRVMRSEGTCRKIEATPCQV